MTHQPLRSITVHQYIDILLTIKRASFTGKAYRDIIKKAKFNLRHKDKPPTLKALLHSDTLSWAAFHKSWAVYRRVKPDKYNKAFLRELMRIRGI